MTVCGVRAGIPNIEKPDCSSSLRPEGVSVLKSTRTMDLKGQQNSERIFLVVMWISTFSSAILTFYFDDVLVMLKTFVGGLALCALVRILQS